MRAHQRSFLCRQTAKEKGSAETSITTEEQGEEENEYFECIDEKNVLEVKENVKNEYVEEINEKDVLEDKENVWLELGSVEDVRDEKKHEKQGEEEGVNFKNEYVEEINEKDVLEDKENVWLESGSVEELRDEKKHEVKTEEDEVEENVAAAVTGEEEVSEAAEREIIQIQVGRRRRRRRRTIRGVARRTYIYRTL